MTQAANVIKDIADLIKVLEAGNPIPTTPLDRSRYPHKCPRCKKPAYIGFSAIDCSAGCSMAEALPPPGWSPPQNAYQGIVNGKWREGILGLVRSDGEPARYGGYAPVQIPRHWFQTDGKSVWNNEYIRFPQCRSGSETISGLDLRFDRISLLIDLTASICVSPWITLSLAPGHLVIQR